jgi:hypothetical protein
MSLLVYIPFFLHYKFTMSTRAMTDRDKTD